MNCVKCLYASPALGSPLTITSNLPHLQRPSHQHLPISPIEVLTTIYLPHSKGLRIEIPKVANRWAFWAIIHNSGSFGKIFYPLSIVSSPTSLWLIFVSYCYCRGIENKLHTYIYTYSYIYIYTYTPNYLTNNCIKHKYGLVIFARALTMK